ncbi:MAG: hypothetical protein KGM15_03755 [Pseudomonadota bacterium]|nr:hypothetical protein [Pseudomonadota bacterium]
MSAAFIAAFGFFLAGAALFLAQLWLQPWSPETFFKLIATDGVLLAIAIVGAFVLRERRETARLRHRRDLD